MLFIFSISCFNISVAQNLVPNPSFEDTVSCPTTANQLDKAVGWHASKESPDYFNECDFITGNTAVPSNFCGYQIAKDGVAYAGFIGYTRTTSNGREYITCQLLSSLVVGVNYLVSFYVSWAGTLGRQVACNKLGMLFSTNDYDIVNPPSTNNYCQFHSDSIISDSTNWVLIQGSFIADSNYSFMTIGNFFTDLNTDTLNIAISSHAYYYIDQITVIEDTITAINENSNINVIIYPNPTHSDLRVESKSATISTLEILTLEGIIVHKRINYYKDSTLKIDLTNLSSGFYFLKLYFGENKLKYLKFLKK